MNPIIQLDAQIRTDGIPINGIADLGGGQYRIDFQNSATDAQKAQAQQIAANFQPVSAPDWFNFRLGMIDSSHAPGKAYQRLCTTIMSTGDTGRLLIIHLNDAAAMEPPNVPALTSLWNIAASMLPSAVAPSADEVAAWRSLATATHMQFTYSDVGAMVVSN